MHSGYYGEKLKWQPIRKTEMSSHLAKVEISSNVRHPPEARAMIAKMLTRPGPRLHRVVVLVGRRIIVPCEEVQRVRVCCLWMRRGLT